MLGAHCVLVTLPILAVGRIGDEIVEAQAGVTIVRERAAEGDVVRVAALRFLHEEIGLRDCPGLRVHLLTKKMNLSVLVDRGANETSVLPEPDSDVLFGDNKHATRPAAGI